MLKPKRTLFGIGIFLFSLAAIPVSLAVLIKGSTYSFLEAPIVFSRDVAKIAVDLFYFRKNAQENIELKRSLAQNRADRFQMEELSQENARLTKLLNIRKILPSNVKRVLFSRVIARSPSSWNRVFLIDKGSRQGVKPNMLVLSEQSLVGKIIECGPSVSKVLLVTDPNFRIGVLIQRTRQQGILFGTSMGECRMKYISVETEIKKQDMVETAGIGGFFPKGFKVGEIERVWKEPGQIYQVAEIKPLTDLSRIEEVLLIE